MSRRNLAIALILSVLLHALLLALVWRMPLAPAPRREGEERPPVEIEIAEVLPGRPVSVPEQRPPAAPPARRDRAKKPPVPSPPTAPSAPAPKEKSAEAARPSLTPSDSVLGAPVPPPEAPGGTTLRPDDPSLSEQARRAEEEYVVKERVDAWAEDAAAESRAQRGLPHPYFTQVGERLRASLDSAEGGTPKELGAPDALEYMFRQYRGAMEEYGRSGTSNVTPPGPSPHANEKQKERFGDDASLVQLYTQSAETLQNLSRGTPLLSLTLELRQAPDGRLLSQRIVQRSSSSKFDAFVLRVVPGALAQLGPVPEPALRGRDELKSVWRIDGWPRLPKNVERWTNLIGTPGGFGIPADPFLRERAASQHFGFRPRLLRAY